MEALVSYVLIPHKYINLKQKTLKKTYPLCLGNISKEFTTNNKKKTGLKGYVYVLQLI